MTETTIQDPTERIKELTKAKKKLLTKIRVGKKGLIKARLEKRKINEELRRLKSKANVFAGMSKEAAADKVRAEIEGVMPAEVYPKDLERRFDKLEAPTKQYKTVDLGKIPERAAARPAADDEAESVGTDAEPEVEAGVDEGVLDLSDL